MIWIASLARLPGDYLERLRACYVTRVYLPLTDCTYQTIEQFSQRGIAVWGFELSVQNSDDLVSRLKTALAAGAEGIVMDYEPEPTERLLIRVRVVVPAGKLAARVNASQLASAKTIAPHVDAILVPCDADSVFAVYEAFRALEISTQLFPILDAKSFASGRLLSSTFAQLPGASVWRAPEVGETSVALEIDYCPPRAIDLGGGSAGDFKLPLLSRVMERGAIGVDVKSLQRVLSSLGYDPSIADGRFGPRTESALRAFQIRAEITPDGRAGPVTWQELGGKLDAKVGARTNNATLALALADFAEKEAARGAQWLGVKSDAEKYLTPFREPMRELGHIAEAPVFYDWCGAFIAYCCLHVGIRVPLTIPQIRLSLASVTAWRFWARSHGFWYDADDLSPRRGDILIHSWKQARALNHITVCRDHIPGSLVVQTSEGNRSNKAGNYERTLKSVVGLIRLT